MLEDKINNYRLKTKQKIQNGRKNGRFLRQTRHFSRTNCHHIVIESEPLSFTHFFISNAKV